MTKKQFKENTTYITTGSGHPIDDDVVVINGVEYRKTVKPDIKQKNNLYDICADWYKDYDEDHPIEDLVDYIVRNWLPEPCDDSGAWSDGFNSYRQILIDTLDGENN